MTVDTTRRLCGAMGAFALSVCAAAPSRATPSRWAGIESVKGFSGWRHELQRLVDAEGHSRINHFCVVAEVFHPPRGPGDVKAPVEERLGHVYWREGRRLIAWDPSDAAVDSTSTRPGNDLDLTKDVRATQAEVGSSTYLVTRSWVRSIVSHCAAQGSQVIVLKGGSDG